MQEITYHSLLGGAVNAPSEEALAQGANPEVMLALTPALMLPLADPQNPTQPIYVPLKTINFLLNGPAAVKLGEGLMTEGARMPGPSRIEVATSLTGAEQAAARLDALRA